MFPKFFLFILMLPLFFLGTLSLSKETKTNLPPFSYLGSNGPNKWGSLCPLYSKCSIGKFQSPINIVKEQVTKMIEYKPLTREYNPSNSTLVNNGFNVGVLFDNNAGPLVVNGKNYTLKQMHWHTPSEHHINGVQYPAELHLVHRAADESISVVAMLLQYGHPNKFLSQIKGKMDELAKKVHAGNEEARIALGMLNMKHMQKNPLKYYRYVGSLTTPPCTEQVVWNVLVKVRSISKEQVLELKAPLNATCRDNSRPLQPLNGRHVELYYDVTNH